MAYAVVTKAVHSACPADLPSPCAFVKCKTGSREDHKGSGLESTTMAVWKRLTDGE